MSVIQRMSDVIQQKVNSVLDKAEDPNEALDLSYQKQLEALQQVRRGVADVLTSEKRLELQQNELNQSQTKLQAQAREAVAQGRDDLARLALTRAQSAQEQLDGLQQQIEQLKAQEQKLEDTAMKLQLTGGAAGQLSAGSIVVRIHGEDQYRLPEADRRKLDQFDADLMSAIRAGDEPRFKGTLTTLLSWVRSEGQKLPGDDLSSSDVVLPSSDMTLKEAQDLVAGEPELSKS